MISDIFTQIVDKIGLFFATLVLAVFFVVVFIQSVLWFLLPFFVYYINCRVKELNEKMMLLIDIIRKDSKKEVQISESLPIIRKTETIDFPCGNCGFAMKASVLVAGEKLRCQQCKSTIIVPNK